MSDICYEQSRYILEYLILMTTVEYYIYISTYLVLVCGVCVLTKTVRTVYYYLQLVSRRYLHFVHLQLLALRLI